MKLIERIILLTVFALIIQHGIFLYVDNIYFSTDLNIEAKKVDDEEAITTKKLDVTIKDTANDVKVSSDGRFVSYLEDGKLKILDINTEKEKVFKNENESEIVFCKWLNDDNSMIIVQKIKEKGKFYFEPIAFNAKKGEVRRLADFQLDEVKIALQNSNDTVDDVVFSNATHSLYIKVNKSNGKCDLYSANIMNEMNRVKYNANIGNFVVPTTNTKAIMEEGANITILDQKTKFSVPKVEKPKILGVDINDNVYFGEEVDGKIKRIYSIVLSDEKIKWNSLNFKNPTEKENIFIDYTGKVYVNNKEEHTVLELTTNKSIKYKGELLQSYSNGVISKVDNKLIKNNL